MNTPHSELLWRYSQQILMTLKKKNEKEKRKMLFSLIKLFAAIL